MPWKRRYRKRKGRKGKKATGKPQGRGFSDRSRIPLRRFKNVTAPTRLVRMTYLTNHIVNSGASGAIAPGAVVHWDLSPFQTPTPNLTFPTIHNTEYRWHDQLALRYAEYQPYSAHVRVWARDMANVALTAAGAIKYQSVDGTVGLLSYYKDEGGNDVVPTYVTDTNHVPLDTYRAWPGGRYVNVPKLQNRAKSKSISCYVRNKDFKGTGGTSTVSKDWYTFDTSHQGAWPTFRIWFSPGRELGWAANDGNAVNIYCFVTVYLKVRQMYELDPLANVAAMANIRAQMAKIDAKAVVSLPQQTCDCPPVNVVQQGDGGLRHQGLGEVSGLGG